MTAVDPPGDTLKAGRYEIIRLLRAAPAKDVYLARDHVLDCDVVVDAIPRAPAGKREYAASWEARLLGRLGDHPNIASAIDTWTDDQCSYIVTRYLSGGSLQDVIDRANANHEPMGGGQVADFALQIARALEHVHGRRVVHRDLQPRNLLLDQWGNLHLVDFDTAVDPDDHDVPELSDDRPVDHTAPEIIRGHRADQRTDLFSLGSTIRAMCDAGMDPAVPASTAPRASKIPRSDLPSGLTDLVSDLLADRRADRPGSAEEVVRRLSELEPLPTHVPAPDPVPGGGKLDQPLLQRVSGGFPYPIARAVRLLTSTQHDMRTRFESTLSVGENVIIMLAVVGLAWNRTHLPTGDPVVEWAEALTHRGLSLGVWLKAARDTAEMEGFGADCAGGVAEALGTVYARRPLLSALDMIVEARNRWVHDGFIYSELEIRRRLRELEPAINEALRGTSFLSHLSLTLVQRSSRRRGSSHFHNLGLLLMGGHPIFRSTAFPTVQPLVEDSIYVHDKASGEVLDLTPFYIGHECPTCGNLEIFYPNRMSAARSVMMKSTDTPHEFRDESLVAELVALGSA